MSDFPTLTPGERIFSPGDYPNTTYVAIGGAENRVRHSNVVAGSSLQLEFTALTEAEMLAILEHYDESLGSYAGFYLPAEVLSGVSVVGDYTLTGYAWSYLEPPVVVDYPCGGHDVSVVLGTSTAPTTDPSPRLFTIPFSLAPGAAAASNGIARTISVTISPGAPSLIVAVPSVIATILIDFPVPDP
jgi:hypothetical protein